MHYRLLTRRTGRPTIIHKAAAKTGSTARSRGQGHEKLRKLWIIEESAQALRGGKPAIDRGLSCARPHNQQHTSASAWKKLVEKALTLCRQVRSWARTTETPWRQLVTSGGLLCTRPHSQQLASSSSRRGKKGFALSSARTWARITETPWQVMWPEQRTPRRWQPK